MGSALKVKNYVFDNFYTNENLISAFPITGPFQVQESGLVWGNQMRKGFMIICYVPGTGKWACIGGPDT